MSVRLVGVLFFASVLGYVGLARATFVIPDSPAEAESCGLSAEDLAAAGVDSDLTRVWLTSFLHTQEYWSALSIGFAVAFGGYAFSMARRLGAGVASGAAVGSGLLTLGALCLSCLAPTLSVIGFGLLGIALTGIPKWAMTVATLALTGGGALFLSRRVTACPITPTRAGLGASEEITR